MFQLPTHLALSLLSKLTARLVYRDGSGWYSGGSEHSRTSLPVHSYLKLPSSYMALDVILFVAGL